MTVSFMPTVSLMPYILPAQTPAGRAAAAGEPMCKELPATERHWCYLDRNWDLQERNRLRSIAETTVTLDNALNLMETPTEEESWFDRAKKHLFSSARRVSFQTENWLRLEAARKSIDMYYLSRGEDKYLKRAQGYLDGALKNEDRNLSFDIYRFAADELLSPTIHPTEGYFEVELTYFNLLTLLNRPDDALAMGQKIEQELNSQRFIQAQRTNVVSAHGYVNRLSLLYGIAGIYNPKMNPLQAYYRATAAHEWAGEQYDSSYWTLWVWDMNKKDLCYDVLLSNNLRGRLQIKLGKYDEALNIFQENLSQPESVRKFGGFIDIGQQAFFNLFLIAFKTSSTLDEAAAKIDRSIAWDKFFSGDLVDFRESLGLVIREEGWGGKTLSFLSDLTKNKVAHPYDLLGNYALRWNWSCLLFKDSNPIKSELDIRPLPTKEKLAVLMKLFQQVEYPFDQKAELIKYYERLR